MGYRALRTIVVATGKRLMTDKVDSTGEPVTRPETRTIEPGGVLSGEEFDRDELAELIARGVIEPGDGSR